MCAETVVPGLAISDALRELPDRLDQLSRPGRGNAKSFRSIPRSGEPSAKFDRLGHVVDYNAVDRGSHLSKIAKGGAASVGVAQRMGQSPI